MSRLVVSVVVVLSGCVASAGPSIGIRANHRVAVGWDVDGTAPNLGASAGQSWSLGANRWYLGGRGVLWGFADHEDSMFPSGRDSTGGTALAGLSIGDGGASMAVAVSPMVYHVPQGVAGMPTYKPLESVELGVRWVGAFEVYVAPKVGVFVNPYLR